MAGPVITGPLAPRIMDFLFPDPPAEDFVNTTFNEQALLMFKINSLAQIHKNYYSGDDLVPPDPTFGPYEKVNLLKGSAAALMNRISNSNFHQKKPLLDFTPAQFSELVPHMRIFKVYRDENGDYEREIEIKFPSFLNFEDVLEPSRGGYGIKSFEVDYASGGSVGAMWAVDKLIKANMTLFFQSFDEFLKKRGSGNEEYSLLDLIVHPPVSGENEEAASLDSPDAESRRYKRYPTSTDAEAFEIKVVFGWSLGPITESSTFNSMDRETRQRYIDAVKNTKLPLFLYLIDHDIAINEDGTILIDIKYQARQDMVSKDIRTDFIKTDGDIIALDIITNQLKLMSNAKKNDPENGEGYDKAMKKIRDKRPKLDQEITKRAFNSIMRELMEPPAGGRSRIFQIQIQRKLLASFIAGELIHDEDATPEEKREEKERRAEEQTAAWLQIVEEIDFSSMREVEEEGISYLIFDPVASEDSEIDPEAYKKSPIIVDEDGNEFVNINWFYLGDLFDIIAKRAFRKRMATDSPRTFSDSISERLKIVLSDFEMRDNITDQNLRINLAHVPVSTKKFAEFFYSKVVAPKKVSYTLNEFMTDFLDSFINDIFLTTKYPFNKEFKQNIKFRLSTFALPSSGGKDPMRQKWNHRSNDPDWSTINVNKVSTDNFVSSLGEVKSVNDYFFYMVIHTDFTGVDLNGDPEADLARGIPHLYIARDRGALKSVNFRKSNIAQIREWRVSQESWDPVVQLASKYDLAIKMMGNTIFVPGMYCFLNPVGIGSTKLGLPQQKNSIASLMGLGGYHLVHDAKLYFEPGKFETEIDALWQTSGSPLESGADGDPIIDAFGRRRPGIGITDEYEV